MVQEITTTSWGKRIINAFFGVLIGIVLIIGAIYLIFWNEGKGLHTAQSLEQTARVVTSVASTPIDDKNNLHVVYLTGIADTNDVLTDNLFKVSEKAIQLNREVKMYQWEENEETTTDKQVGGSEKETKTYTYKQIWSAEKIDSSDFKDQTGHQNPSSMPIKSKIQYANHVTVGDFKLPADLINQISGSTSVDLNKIDLTKLEAKFNKPVKMLGDKIYIGEDSEMPKIGDMQVTITVVLPTTVSIIAQQAGQSLQPYMAPAGQAVSLIEMGQISPQEMIHNAEVKNKTMMWLLRLASLIMMIIGFALIMNPLKVLADVLPFLGNLVGIGTGFIAFILGLCLWILCIAIAWFIVRPLISIIMIILVVLICGFFLVKKRSQ